MNSIIVEKIESNTTLRECLDSLQGKYPLRECVTGYEPIQSTLFNVYHDGDNLYFVYAVRDDEINSVRTEYNSALYEEEVVEVFISGADRSRYIELELSPNNTQFCGLITISSERKLKLLYPTIIDSTIERTDYGYKAIIKIPIIKICDYLNIDRLDICYINAYRIDRPKGKAWELSALSPTFKEDFHCIESFIRLIMEE